MKKILCMLLIAVSLTCLLSGCLPSWIKWLPTQFPKSTWVSQAPEAMFYFEYSAPATGWIMQNGEKVSVCVEFDYGGTVYFLKEGASSIAYDDVDCVIAGRYRAYEGKLVVTVEKDLLFDNEYKKIIFYMVDTPEETAAPEN